MSYGQAKYHDFIASTILYNNDKPIFASIFKIDIKSKSRSWISSYADLSAEKNISGSFIVRPDGMVTTSLVEDIKVSGKTPTMLARHIEVELAKYINNPRVTVSVGGFQGPLYEQVRVIGEATNPSAVNYTEKMTLLDLMISVGGLTEFASGNNAKLIRMVDGVQNTYELRIDELIKEGLIEENIDMLPGDIVIIPEAWF